MSIGAGPAGVDQVVGGALANDKHGVYAHESAKEISISGCIISGNKGDGVRTRAPVSVLDGNAIGQSASVGDVKSGNLGSGVHLEETAVGARIGSRRK